LRSAFTKQVITYDDPESIGLKAAFAKEVGMLGVNLFDLHGDTDYWDLTDSARKSIGLR
jgi:chitinase